VLHYFGLSVFALGVEDYHATKILRALSSLSYAPIIVEIILLIIVKRKTFLRFINILEFGKLQVGKKKDYELRIRDETYQYLALKKLSSRLNKKL